MQRVEGGMWVVALVCDGPWVAARGHSDAPAMSYWHGVAIRMGWQAASGT